VVGTDVGGVRDTFLNGQSGFLIEGNDVTKFADRILLLTQNKALRKEMGEKGHDFVKEHFSKQAEIKACRKLYEESLASVKNK
jgi:glycosyltransferase involved in cell wall biosynthesis